MISLHEITPELMHQYYRQFESDPDLFMDMIQYTPYQYDPEKVDARYHAKKASTDRRDFFIMRCGKPVGEVILKHINLENGECELSIHLQNNSVKNQGIGTRAEQLLLDYAFRELKMCVVFADAVHKNTRSQHVLEKVGFEFVGEDSIFKHYIITQKRYREFYSNL